MYTSKHSVKLTGSRQHTMFHFLWSAIAMIMLLLSNLPAWSVQYIKDVLLIGGSQSLTNSLKQNYQEQGWTLIDYDLNKGAGGDYIYLLYKTENNCSDPITSVSIYMGADGVTDIKENNGTLWYLAPHEGSKHFMDVKGDLNSGTGNNTDAIHLYYTREKYEESIYSGLEKLYVDNNEENSVGNAGSHSLDLNKGAGGESIYLHSKLYYPGVYEVMPTDTGRLGILDNGDLIYGRGGIHNRIVIADGATVILDGVDFSETGTGDDTYAQYPGIRCEGNATIILAEGSTNSICGGFSSYPGIWPGPEGTTLTIRGNGSLIVRSNGYGAGIGAPRGSSCGDIVIEDGNITVQSFATHKVNGTNIIYRGMSAAIGAGYNGTCGNITILGGNITAESSCGSAIGSCFGGKCGDINILGGTVFAKANNFDYNVNGKQIKCLSAAIGSSEVGTCGNITISNDVTCVTATKMNDAPYSIGAGGNNQYGNSVCGTVTIGAQEMGNISENPFIYTPIVRVPLYTTTSGTEGETGQGYQNFVDNDKSTKWCVIKDNNTSWTGTAFVEFNSENPFIPMGYILTTGDDNEQFKGRNPRNWVLKAKLDSDDQWVTIATVTNDTVLKDVNNADFRFAINNSSPYRYFRFEVSAVQSGNTLQLSEIKLIEGKNSSNKDLIKDVMLIGGSEDEVNSLKATYQEQGWCVIDYDLNKGAGGDYIYLIYKSEKAVHNVDNTYITDFCIYNKSNPPATLTYDDITYTHVPYDGGSHFEGTNGDLNSNAGGASIHLYYTKAHFTDNRVVADIFFDKNSGGAVGMYGENKGYDLNHYANGQYIYMHTTNVIGHGLPYFYGFETPLDEEGSWRGVNINDISGIIEYREAVHGGNKGFYFSPTMETISKKTEQILVSPEFDGRSGLVLEFQYHYRNRVATFQVGYSTQSDDIESFIWDDEIVADNRSWTKFERFFPKGTKYVAIKYITHPLILEYLYLDDLLCTENNHPSPDNLEITSCTEHSASFVWEEPDINNPITEYVYQYRKSSDPDWVWSDEVRVDGNKTTARISGLSGDTDYLFRVKAIYGDQESVFSKIRFVTATSLPYDFGFENGLGHWSMVDCNIIESYIYDINQKRLTGLRAAANREGRVGFLIDRSKTEQYLISPAFPTNAVIKCSFWYRSFSVCDCYNAYFQVGYSTTDKNIDSFIWSDKITAEGGQWQYYENLFPAGARYIAIKELPTSEYDLYLDDFSFEAFSSYSMPENISGSMTDKRISLSWQVPNNLVTGYAYQYRSQGSSGWSDEVTLNTNEVTLNDLSPNTGYNFRVKALYDGNNASNYKTISFATEGSPESIPFSQGFEHGLGGWRVKDGVIRSTIYSSQTSSVLPHSGDYCFSFNCEVSRDQYLISPYIDSDSPFKISLWYVGSNIEVGYSTTSKALDTFIWDTDIAEAKNWTQYTASLPAGTKYIAIKWIDGWFVYLDDFCFTDDKTVTFSKEGYSTFYSSKYDVTIPPGVKARTIKCNYNTGELYYETVADGDAWNNTVYSCTAVLLQRAPSNDVSTVTLKTSYPPAPKGVHVAYDYYPMLGSDDPSLTTGGDKYYKLTYDTDGKNIGWYWGAEDGGPFMNEANKAWLTILNGQDSPGRYIGLPDYDDVTTEITIIPCDDKKDDVWYDLFGRKLDGKPTVNDLYIHNGEKVLINTNETAPR